MPRYYLYIILILSALILTCCTEDEPTGSGPNQIPSLYDVERFEFQSKTFLKVESNAYGFVIIFELTDEMANHTFEASVEIFPSILKDEEGGHWNIFGECISGPFEGQRLKATNATYAYWFTWINLFENYWFNGEIKMNNPIPVDDPSWNISTDYVNEGAIFDAIPSIDDPQFETLSFKECLENYNFLSENDLVIVASLNGETKVYPIKILDHHEIVNDLLGGEPIVVSYAPYTGSPAVHLGNYKNEEYTFGVSGQVYMNNMLLFDRQTFSFWSQLLNRVVTGELLGAELQPVSFVQLKWGTWKNAADNYTILSEDQGFEKDYRTPKFDNYIANDSFIPFDVPVADDSQLNKSLFYGLSIANEVRLYQEP
ncbi:MAG: DUF3179 domain-containing protein [Saprospiraceae bacterium]|nr:DUF3179 domain-containing protein [Saprospiraceae bacterium]